VRGPCEAGAPHRQKPSPSHPKRESSHPGSFWLKQTCCAVEGGAKGLELRALAELTRRQQAPGLTEERFPPEAEAEPFAPKKEILVPQPVFGLNTALPGFKGGREGARTFAPPAELTDSFWLEQTRRPVEGGVKGARSSRPGELIAPTAGTLG